MSKLKYDEKKEGWKISESERGKRIKNKN